MPERAEVVVTASLDDFPRLRSSPFDITAQEPDSFVLDLMSSTPVSSDGFCVSKPPTYRTPHSAHEVGDALEEAVL